MRKLLWGFLEIFETIAIAVVSVFLVRTFIAQPFLVSGSSMEPTFSHRNYLLVDELTYRFREPERGEVVVFRYPKEQRSFYIKRIIGLPGERVAVDESGVTVYRGSERKVLAEPYLGEWRGRERIDVTLGPHQYFVMGDNRNASFDSRNWGPLSRGDLVGLARLRLWPVSEAMAFSKPAY